MMSPILYLFVVCWHSVVVVPLFRVCLLLLRVRKLRDYVVTWSVQHSDRLMTNAGINQPWFHHRRVTRVGMCSRWLRITENAFAQKCCQFRFVTISFNCSATNLIAKRWISCRWGLKAHKTLVWSTAHGVPSIPRAFWGAAWMTSASNCSTRRARPPWEPPRSSWATPSKSSWWWRRRPRCLESYPTSQEWNLWVNPSTRLRRMWPRLGLVFRTYWRPSKSSINSHLPLC